MWEKLVNCIKGGASGSGAQKKGCQVVLLSDLMKQVPPNQQMQFKLFAKKHEEYKARVRKYPESMPNIDWEYYRKNVRAEMVDWVNSYETKYDKLHSIFENRHAMVDHKRYFDLVDKEREEVLKEISAYKEASNERIKKLSERKEFMKALKPYEEMTMEEFCFARPHLAPDFINKPTFWPHTPEEQMPGPTDPEAAAALHEEQEPEPKEPPKKPKPPAPEKAAAVAAPKKPSEAKKNVEATASDLSAKATALAKDLVAKATVLFYTLKEKMAGIAKNVQKKAEAAKAARAEAADNAKTSTTSVSEETRDRISQREPGSSVCNQTIIRSAVEEAHNPEIKAQHVDLTIEADPCEDREPVCEEVCDPCESKKKERVCDPCESQKEELVCEAESDPCKAKEEELVCEKELVCEPESDPCKAKKEEFVCEEELVCEAESDPCKLKEEEPVCGPIKDTKPVCKPKKEESCEDDKQDDDPCKSKNKDHKDGGAGSASAEQVYINISKCSEELAKKNEEKSGDKPKESASLGQKIEGMDQKSIMGKHDCESKDPKSDEKATIGGADEVGPVYTDPTQIAHLLTKKKEAKELKEVEEIRIEEAKKPEDDKPLTIYPRREISAKPKPQVQDAEETKIAPEDLAKQVYSAATGAASLLSEATNTLDDLKKKKEDRLEVMEQAYISAQRQAVGALAEASKAVNTASKLAQKVRQATGEVSSEDKEALAMAEKHALLAKMLANRAVALKDDIARVLKDLKKKE